MALASIINRSIMPSVINSSNRMNFHDLSIIVRQIKKNISCPKCKGAYNNEDIEIIGSLGDEQTFFHASCNTCNAESVINVSLQFDNEASEKPTLSRLGSAPRIGKVSSNEVLDMSNFLKGFDGNFVKLFNKDERKTS